MLRAIHGREITKDRKSRNLGIHIVSGLNIHNGFTTLEMGRMGHCEAMGQGTALGKRLDLW